MKKFDLNIDRMLKNKDAFHAVREVIANALDEQALTGTQEIVIARDGDGLWRIRDFGRGLRHEHFTMNENQEKLDHPGLINKFGVGLKDALATFDRQGIETRIHSKFCDVAFDRSEKHDFSDVITLHPRPVRPRVRRNGIRPPRLLRRRRGEGQATGRGVWRGSGRPGRYPSPEWLRSRSCRTEARLQIEWKKGGRNETGII